LPTLVPQAQTYLDYRKAGVKVGLIAFGSPNGEVQGHSASALGLILPSQHDLPGSL
jgi:hypothetical protein